MISTLNIQGCSRVSMLELKQEGGRAGGDMLDSSSAEKALGVTTVLTSPLSWGQGGVS